MSRGASAGCAARLLRCWAAAAQRATHRAARPLAPLAAEAALRRGAAAPTAQRFPDGGNAHARGRVALLGGWRRLAVGAAAGDGGISGGGGEAAPVLHRLTLTRVTGSDIDALSDLLLGLGAFSCTIEDADRGTAAEVELFDDMRGKAWGSNNVVALFSEEGDLHAALEVVQSALGPLHYAVDNALDSSWEAAVRGEYKPIEVEEGLWIVPAWQAPPVPAAPLIISLEPGLAFGTGEHPTTRLCLRWLRAAVAPGAAVLDYGCGSGVLAIAALRLGAASADALDVDPLAVTSSRANAALNGVEARLRAAPVAADGADAPAALRGACDIVVANILLGPLLALAPQLAAYARPGSGRVALSGVLVTQAPQVVAAYAPWLEEMRVEEDGEWALVTGRRKA